MASSRDPAQSHYVEVNGQRLHYKQWSQNGPPLLFLHGVTSSGSSWDIISPQFMLHYRVMAFDLRGHGLSSKPASGYTWAEDYAADLVEFINTHLDEPVIVVGHSLGAAITVPIAASTPDRVRAVVERLAFYEKARKAQYLCRFGQEGLVDVCTEWWEDMHSHRGP